MLKYAFFCLPFALIGCASTQIPQPSTTSVSGLSIHSSTSDIQTSFLKSRSSEEHFCDSRASDVADTSSQSLGIAASFLGKKESLNEGSSRGAVSLGGRSSSVLITREVLYRTCEMIMNMNLDKEQSIDLYLHSLDVILDIAKTDQVVGAKTIAAIPEVPKE